jgi:hypothetical protein
VDAVREIMEFYYKKGENGLLVGYLPAGMEAPYVEKKGQNFILFLFYMILNLEVGRRSKSLPVSNVLRASGRNWGDSLHMPS